MTRVESILRTAIQGGVAGLFLLIGASGCGGPEYPNCNNDGDCHEGEFCVNGLCQQCRPGENDCGAGQDCVDGRCEDIPGYCTSTSDCPDGQECQNNRCVTAQSEDLGDTGTGPTACSLSTVYFGYDSSELDGSTRSTLQSNANCINEREIQSVTLVGHADPRGTEEYNLALGDRRARSVKSYMENLGVPGDRMSTRSMGEEMASGSNESSWSRDRRVEFQER